MVDDLLGRPKVHPEKAARQDQVGVATGMYYTPTGGDIMFVEASTMRGKGELVLTGQLGDVMKESARAALDLRPVARGRRSRSRTRCSTATSTSTCPRARSRRTVPRPA